MAFWSKWFKKRKDANPNLSVADYLNGYFPSYWQFGEDIYASDVVQQAIFSIVSELSKLDPVHTRNDVVVDGNIQSVLDKPNPLMTTSDFIEKIAWNLLLNSNAFVYPMWEGNNLVALYPLQPTFVDFLQDGFGNIHTKLHFQNGYETTVPYSDLIHVRYKYSVSEFMGGNKEGQPDNKALLDTLKLNDTLLKGLAKSLNMQTAIHGIIKIKTMMNFDDQIAKVKEFEKKLLSNESGILATDIGNEFVPVSNSVQLLDATTLEFIDKKIFRWFGTSIAIVDGDYTPSQYEAFYQKTLEPIIRKLNQAFTKGIFSKREEGFKNKIEFLTDELKFMTKDQKLAYYQRLIDVGGCYINEYRKDFGKRPLKELDGKIMMSLNYINKDEASKYQVGNDGGGNEDGNE